ncbi:MAG: prepilin-type N-terminal cleavage/methylation domain-containing protein [Cyanobacteria bacterium K_DeepCast_35m_m2_155]|nr:prepilin-type N-terminal cleavage/methylation domain-containing protein [Cyanobacteria bacterium K_DeepCast_35m_m2_155]
MQRCDDGMTLPELLLALVVVVLMASLGWSGMGRSLARSRVEAAARQLVVGLEQARNAAEVAGSPCALALSSAGWAEATAAESGSELPPCQLSERRLGAGVQLRHNLPGALRVASNGLVLDGGTVVVAAHGTDLRRCLVVSLPLGVVRMGRSKAAAGAAIRSVDCVADPSL